MSCSNSNVVKWVEQSVALLQPERVVWVDGSEAEYKGICDLLVEQGTFKRLNPEKYPNCFWCVSDPKDVARVEDRTFICSKSEADCGPTNHWRDPREMYDLLYSIIRGGMRGRTMYVVPYLMGPDGSPFSKVGFELTDSPYVVANMKIMARIGKVALKNLPDHSNDFVRGLHTIGQLDSEKRYICHFPEDNTIISINSNYGGNALQGKKCFALRIASCQARREGWLAEHMLILGITNPAGKKIYVTGAFPSACGKTNLAMLIPPKLYTDAGWKVETVGDDIAWLNFGSDGRLYAINPEAGFFGVAPGTSYATNPAAMDTIRANTIFTNTALDLDNMTPWWDRMTDQPPKRAKDWLNRDWTPASKDKPAHPNSRFTAPAGQCPTIAPEWETPNGVPISAIIFGGRRTKVAPLIYEAFNWQHGTYTGVTMCSETTAAAEGKVGQLRRDPMAMLPFIGYHAGDYFQHWLDIGQRAGAVLPRIYHVNWFRRNAAGEFMWPGYGDNMRVLEWIFDRVTAGKDAEKTALGFQPRPSDVRTAGLSISDSTMRELFEVRPEDWREELDSQSKFFETIGSKVPKALWQEHAALKQRLGLK
ncbi:MAG: phosphoenolpyruvate carboxykinase (GTP) [Oligoflexia bacterium]|nr:phosphoenolpyruvate carboxykinase (GTP) [Oligoflexia bacterium]